MTTDRLIARAEAHLIACPGLGIDTKQVIRDLADTLSRLTAPLPAEIAGLCEILDEFPASSAPRKAAAAIRALSYRIAELEAERDIAIRRVHDLERQRIELEDERDAIRRKTIEECATIADDEPELEGQMPDELRLVPLEDALRATCRATKKSIANHIRALAQTDENKPKTEK